GRSAWAGCCGAVVRGMGAGFPRAALVWGWGLWCQCMTVPSIIRCGRSLRGCFPAATYMALPSLSFKPRMVGKRCQGFTAMTRSPANDVTTSLRAAQAGDPEVAARLLPLVHDELRLRVALCNGTESTLCA